MPQFGGKNAKKKMSSSSSTKRHFTVVIGSKEHGIYVSSSPSSAARKAVSKLCATDKKKKVQFSIREITQGSKKKTYGPYLGSIEKLKEPIELKGRVIRYKPVAKLSGKTGKMKGGMNGGFRELILEIKYYHNESSNHDDEKWVRIVIEQEEKLKEFLSKEKNRDIFLFDSHTTPLERNKILSTLTTLHFVEYKKFIKVLEYDKKEYDKKIKELIDIIKSIKRVFKESPFSELDEKKFKFIIPEARNNNSEDGNNNSEHTYKKFLKYLHSELEKQ